MWPECFAHTRGGAVAVLGGRRAASRRCASPPRSPAGRRCRPPAASVGGRRGLEAGSARRAARPPPPARPRPPPARPGAPGDGRRRGTPAQPLPAGRRGAPLPKGPRQPFAAAGGQGGGGLRGRGRGLGEALLLAGCAARDLPRGWPWPGPHVEQR
jgi:hypothetical protein